MSNAVLVIQTIGHYIVIMLAMVLAFLLAWHFDATYTGVVLTALVAAITGVSAIKVSDILRNGHPS